MPTFQYKAKTQAGQLVTGTLAAGDRRTALAELGRRGYFPLHVDVSESADAKQKITGGFRGRVTTRDTLMFTQQLSSLLRSGMSLSDGLGVLERRTQKKSMSAIMGSLRGDIVQGETLSAALAKHPRLFSKFFINLVRA